MKNCIKFITLLSFLMVLVYCNQKKTENQDTILKGKVDILVDETLAPIIEDQIQIFESIYNAKITTYIKSETEVLQGLIKNKYHIAIMSNNTLAWCVTGGTKRKWIILKTKMVAGERTYSQ